MDGIAARVTEAKVRGVFSRAGRVMDVQIMQKRRGDVRFRMALVFFATIDEARRAIRLNNGLRLEGHYLVVRMAREQWRLRDGRKQRRWGEKELRYQVQGRVWKPKGNTTTQVNT